MDYLTQDYRQTTPHAYLSRIAPLTEGEHIVEAVRATAQECAWLTIKEHEPCLLIRRTTWSASRIVSHARLLFPGSRYGYRDDLSPERTAAGNVIADTI
ncbi:histidine utilization repressor [Salmonella enterica subsp. enterica serovar Madelia]|nr:histidine utilization repressor [Salmonella enterica subsp. enterica serovar Madelia]